MTTSDGDLVLKINIKINGEPTLIPPAKETPKDLYFLSNFDAGPIMVKTIQCFNYKATDGELDAAQAIKDGLAKVLVHYYPLAGRLTRQKHFMINCTGEGALFVEAEADCTLENIHSYFTKPNSVALEKLVYDIGDGAENPPLLVAQVTRFKCGGFVFGLCMNHIIFDGIGAMEFVNSWGEVTRGLPLSNPPFLDRTLLKARDPPAVEFVHGLEPIVDMSSSTMALLEEETLINESIVLLPEKLEQLKKKAMEDGVLKRCTTFEALTAFMWRARTQSLGLHPDQQVRVLFTVDGRSKIEPPLPRGYFGNAAVFVSCQFSARELTENPLSSTVERIQEAIKSVTNDYIRSTLDFFEEKMEWKPLTYTIFLNAWSRLGFHNVDFGWGQPIYSGPLSVAKDMVLFLPHGKAINLCLTLPASTMKIFQELVDEI
ncbi:hypothetical protein MKW94_028014 [Papaver nudicaule]|uniref:Omega-hydroxypalmitate O-feruloyl transferase n=1 Tax=Papaver nudicaule TaxID=74823 RepID=A0AA41RMH8_PAPNU|nr:hypothetical protein [Papaver nudicaule]